MKLNSIFSSFIGKIKKVKIDKKSIPPELALLPPPPIWSRLLIWTLGSGTVFLLVWSLVVKVDDIVLFNGEITTSSPEVRISIQDPGIIKRIDTKPHQAINKDEVILVYDDEQIDLRINSIRQRITLLELKLISDLNLFKLRRQQTIQQLELDENLLARMEFLLRSGAVEETQVLKQRTQITKGKIQLSSLDEERQRSEYQIQQSLEELKSSEEDLTSRKKRFTVLSPVTGYIQQMKYQTIGERIQSGEVIATIIPKRDLIARISIPSKLQAPVEINSEATVSVDAFPSSDYGSINAVVKSLSPTTVENSRNSSAPSKQYNADLELLNATNPDLLQLEFLKPGMFVTAQMVLRDKPIITTVFKMLDKIFAPLTEQS